jgi:hypothetical protein
MTGRTGRKDAAFKQQRVQDVGLEEENAVGCAASCGRGRPADWDKSFARICCGCGCSVEGWARALTGPFFRWRPGGLAL